ncbi:MAG: hypothetical protein LBV44_06520, partial [Methylobacillus sp.]|nr:hypothetical protein [Methylobacillus sp.]
MSLAPQAKRALRIALWAIFSMALVAGIGIWWIAHDEPLLPEVEAALRFDPPTPEVMRDNGYFTMLGLGAPPEEDALAAGQRFFAAQVKDYEEYQRAGNLEKSSAYDAFPHQSIIMEPIRCDATADDCYAHYLENAQAIKDKLAGQKVLVERYLSLRDKPDYEEINQSPCAACALPYFSYVAAASELTTMRAALLLNDGHVDEALTLLETNAKIHRKMMEGARTLVGAMIALAMDMRQQRLISSALRHVPALSADHAQRLDALVQSSAPVPLTAALEYEMKFQLAFFSTLQPTADVISLDLEHADTERELGSWLQNR